MRRNDEASGKGTELDVADRAVRDPKTGRFVRGNQAAKGNVGIERTKKADALRLLDELNDEFPDEELTMMLRHVWETAVKTRSGKIMLAVWQEIVDRKYGKAVGRQVNFNGELDEFLSLFKPAKSGGEVVNAAEEQQRADDTVKRLLDAGTVRLNSMDMEVDVDLDSPGGEDGEDT